MKNLSYRCLLMLFIINGFQLFSFGQNPNIVNKDYARNSLTLLVLDYGDSPYMEYFRSPGRLKVPDKFDDNNLNFTLLPSNFNRNSMINNTNSTGITIGVKNLLTASFVEPLFQLVKDKKVPNAIIAKEFNRQPDGSFNMDVIAQRGMYNADEADYSKSQATMRKDDALRDAGELLLNNSYILIFDYSKIQTMTEVYNAMDAVNKTPVKRTQNGYKSNGYAYLYRVDLNDSVYNNFLQTMWVDASANAQLRQERAGLFDNTIFPIERIAIFTFDAEALQYNADQGVLAPKVQKTTEQLFDEMVLNSKNTVITTIEKLSNKFRVTSQITQTHPIGVKIGTKEGLNVDQRYFVYEQQIVNGKEKSVRKGVIRSKSVSENRSFISDTKGKIDPSYFYQTAGKKLHAMGMFVEQKNDLGLGLCIGFVAGGQSGVNASLEYNIMSLFSRKSGITALRLYLAGGVNYASFESPSLVGLYTSDPFLFYHFEGGLAKDFYFMRNFHIGPVIGVGLENASSTEDITDSNLNTGTYSLSTLYGTGGIRFGVNLLHNLQLQLSANYYMPFGTVTEDLTNSDGNSYSGWPYESSDSWDEFFDGRKGLGIGAGLRLQF
jgi:hypothetical protein